MDSCSRTCHDCPELFVCRCLRVTETALCEAVRTQAIRDLKELRRATGAGDGCTCCHDRLRRYLQQESQASSPLPICSVK